MLRPFAILTFIALLTGPAQADRYRDTTVPISPVATLDLGRYLGLWHEIARFPNRFERGCEGVTAQYSLRDDGKIRVLNTCRDGSPAGQATTADGVASVVSGGKLEVTFVPWLPFAKGDYWVLYIDPAYSLAVVGEPKGKTGWILARGKTVTAAQRNTALKTLAANGYDTSKLYWVKQ